MMWDLTTLFPDWVSSVKLGANAYQPVGRGSLLMPGANSAGGGGGSVPMELSGDEDDEGMQIALAMSMAEAQGGGGGGSSSGSGSAGEETPVAPPVAQEGKPQDMEATAEDEEERAMQEAIALSLS